MRARPIAPSLAVLSLLACGAPGASTSTSRVAETRAALARPEPDPALHGTPQGGRAIRAIEQVSVRVRRGPDGRLTVVEFLSAGLTEAERSDIRRAVEAGELRPEGEAPPGEESWITTLLRTRVR